MNWYVKVLKQYSVFDGRARRKEYWYFFLFNLLVLFGIAYFDRFIGSYHAESGLNLFTTIYALAVFVPGLAVTVRRLHDTGRGAWWLLIALVPFAGAIAVLMLMAQNGKPGKNQYGVNPKEAEV